MTFSAGLAIKGAKPYFAVYSSFLQRSFDQIIHDVAIAGVPVRICVDRAGIVGEDGESHQGVFDAAFLSTVPGMRIYSPCYYSELENIIEKSADFDGPVAIRYPRGNAPEFGSEFASNKEFSVVGEGEIAIVTYGRISANAFKAQKELKESKINCAVIKLNLIYPFSEELINTLKKYRKLYFFEEGVRSGGIAEHLISRLENEIDFKIFAIEDAFVPSAKIDSALKKYKLDSESMYSIIKGEL